MSCLVATIMAAFVALSGVGVKGDEPNLTQQILCNEACTNFAIREGLDSALSLCGEYVGKSLYDVNYNYQKCLTPESVEAVTAQATRAVDSANNEKTGLFKRLGFFKKHGSDMSFYAHDCSVLPDRDCTGALRDALFEFKRAVYADEEGIWNDKEGCEWLVGRPAEFALPFCKANVKNAPGCDKYLKIYGKCEQILEDAANNKGEL